MLKYTTLVSNRSVSSRFVSSCWPDRRAHAAQSNAHAVFALAPWPDRRAHAEESNAHALCEFARPDCARKSLAHAGG